MALFDCTMLGFFKDKIKNFWYIILMISPLIYFIVVGTIAYINELENIFPYYILSFLFGSLSFLFVVLLKDTKTLNKTDAYNIMILIFTIISLALSVFSIIG